jgi:K+-sensing histidine kinase KdpD
MVDPCSNQPISSPLEKFVDGTGPFPSWRISENLRIETEEAEAKPNGAGVGLGVARSVVQGMGGTVELSARSQTMPDEKGCLFRVRFPCVTLNTTQYRHTA